MIIDRKIVKPEAHRTNITVADTSPDISDSAGASGVQDQVHLACITECSAGGVTGSICLAMWDKNGVFIGISEAQSFTADSIWRNGISGGYIAPSMIFDIMGASKIKALVKSLSGGNITNLYLVPLAFMPDLM